jgi:hypothetical protein
MRGMKTERAIGFEPLKRCSEEETPLTSARSDSDAQAAKLSGFVCPRSGGLTVWIGQLLTTNASTARTLHQGQGPTVEFVARTARTPGLPGIANGFLVGNEKSEEKVLEICGLFR